MVRGEPPRAPGREPARTWLVCEGAKRGRPGKYRVRQLSRGQALLREPHPHKRDTWVEWVPRRKDGRDAEPQRLVLEATPSKSSDRSDLRVWLPELGGRLTYTRLLAHACCGWSWDDLKAKQVDHANDKWWDCRLANLVVMDAEANAAKEKERTARGDRPVRGPDSAHRKPRGKQICKKPRVKKICKNTPATCGRFAWRGRGYKGPFCCCDTKVQKQAKLRDARRRT